MAEDKRIKEDADLATANILFTGHVSRRDAQDAQALIENPALKNASTGQSRAVDYLLALEEAIAAKQAIDPTYPSDLTDKRNIALMEEIAEQYSSANAKSQPRPRKG